MIGLLTLSGALFHLVSFPVHGAFFDATLTHGCARAYGENLPSSDDEDLEPPWTMSEADVTWNITRGLVEIAM